MQSRDVANPQYVPELDCFRFVAILSVMCLHWLPESFRINRLQGAVSNGVHLFFVLSGFLITGILIRCRRDFDSAHATATRSLAMFYARRFLRIMPAYYLALGIGVAFNFTAVRSAALWHAGYLSNIYYFNVHDFQGPASPFWTLAVEEQFYLVWPVLILFVPRRLILPGVAVVALGTTALRAWATLHYDPWRNLLLPQCSGFLAVGALMTLAGDPYTGSARTRRRLVSLFVGLIVIGLGADVLLVARLGKDWAITSPVMHAIDQPMMAMVYAIVFAWSAGAGGPMWVRSVLRFRPFVYLGRISYGLYLYHQFVNFGLRSLSHRIEHVIGHRAGQWATTSFPALFVVTVAVASVSWLAFEKPLNDLKRFFPYSRRPAGAGATSPLPTLTTSPR